MLNFFTVRNGVVCLMYIYRSVTMDEIAGRRKAERLEGGRRKKRTIKFVKKKIYKNEERQDSDLGPHTRG